MQSVVGLMCSPVGKGKILHINSKVTTDKNVWFSHIATSCSNPNVRCRMDLSRLPIWSRRIRYHLESQDPQFTPLFQLFRRVRVSSKNLFFNLKNSIGNQHPEATAHQIFSFPRELKADLKDNLDILENKLCIPELHCGRKFD
jgi:hypothetical protein